MTTRGLSAGFRLVASLTKKGRTIFATSDNIELYSNALDPNLVASASRARTAATSVGFGTGDARL